MATLKFLSIFGICLCNLIFICESLSTTTSGPPPYGLERPTSKPLYLDHSKKLLPPPITTQPVHFQKETLDHAQVKSGKCAVIFISILLTVHT